MEGQGTAVKRQWMVKDGVGGFVRSRRCPTAGSGTLKDRESRRCMAWSMSQGQLDAIKEMRVCWIRQGYVISLFVGLDRAASSLCLLD